MSTFPARTGIIMPLPSEKSLSSVNRVLSIVAAVGLGAAAGWFCFQYRDADLSTADLNPMRLYFRLMTGHRPEEVVEKALQQEPVFEPVFAYDREDFPQLDSDWHRSLHAPMFNPDEMTWGRGR